MEHIREGLLVAGDFCPINRLAPLVAQGSTDRILNDLLPLVRSKELAIVNMECPLTRATHLIKKTGPLLKASEDAAEMLANAGFNMVTLANNHIMDYGSEGLESTVQVCQKHGLATVGAGQNISEARRVHYTMVDKQRVAILNFSENEFSTTHGPEPGANPMDLANNFRDIQAARTLVDYVMVIVHGGHEMFNLPSPRIKKTFRFYADAGASAVFGHHPHCFSGYEVYKGKPLFYSLGNFLFDDPVNKNPLWHSGYAVAVSLKNSLEFELLPYLQCSSTIGVELMKGQQLEHFYQDLNRLNALIRDDEKLQTEFERYCQQVSKMYAAYLEPFSRRWLRMLQGMRLLPSLMSGRKKRLYLNLTRCESHRDVVIHLLKPKMPDDSYSK